jgi:lipid II:glycine glycyltransferase (peptidoglycan interpeptide bridge formation enzyme)
VRFFEHLRQHVLEKGLGFLMMAHHKKKAVAGALFLLFSGKAIFKYGASDRRYQEFRANNLVFRDAIRLLCGKGARTLSFGRTNFGHEGLRQFKMSWGTMESRHQYVKYEVRSKTYLTAEQSLWENRWKKAFAKLPLSVLRIIGSVAYRHAG